MTTNETRERFEKLWNETDVADALLDYAHSEGYENPMGYPPEQFEKFISFIEKEKELAVEKLASQVNRVEVIDHTAKVEDGGGRAYVYWNDTKPKVELSLQDEGRTLKIFISPTLTKSKLKKK